MKGLFYIACVVLLMVQTSASGFCINSIIPENNYTIKKHCIKQTRYKAFSSYVKKAKKIKPLSFLFSTQSDSQQLEGDDLGGDDKWENSREDSIAGTVFSFKIFASGLRGHPFPARRYNSFIQFNIPPPKYA
ncbi:MAG: hypothetical protein KKG00_08830 [Bacteroidetes bacterium]|nr:hypothetical protein [Bacteroidota bacterium]